MSCSESPANGGEPHPAQGIHQACLRDLPYTECRYMLFGLTVACGVDLQMLS